MWSKKHVALGGATSLGVIALLAGLFATHGGGAAAAPAAKGPASSPVQATYVGSGSMSATSGSASGGVTSQEFGPTTDEQIPHSATIVHVAASGVPNPAGQSVVTDSATAGFAGLNHFQQRFAGTGAYAGTQFSLEPPDQALCVGGGYVVESINTAVRVYDSAGHPLTAPTALNQFFGLTPEINRTTGVFGDFTSDPKCYYDSDTGHFFLTMLQIDVDPATGAFLNHAHTEIAVSKTSNPTGSWNILSFDTTDDGTNGTPSHTACPCFGDQPLIGADKYGFYVTTNEFPITAAGFNGAQVYAFSKAALEKGSTANGVHFDAGSVATPDAGGIWYSIQPATSPSAQYATANNGTEYFLSALDFSAKLDNRVATWALTNTASLNSNSPALNLSLAVIGSEVYGQPPNAIQKNGLTPLGDSVKNPAELIASNDDRMNQVVFAGGKLWSGVNSVVQTPNGPTRSAIAYFEVAPSASGSSLSATMAGQGYVAANQENALYPSIGVNANGGAVMVFTLVGPDYFPSAAYYDLTGGDGNIHIAGAGQGPDDGFTGYKKSAGVAEPGRWGDYTAAVAGPDGSIWMATEYIGQSCSDAQYAADTTCGGTRTLLANWGTYIINVQP
jgi:hypothetical protein